jgi:MFS superfamily sulfate permease-like transporter
MKQQFIKKGRLLFPFMQFLSRYIPAVDWLLNYQPRYLVVDLTAGIIVTSLLIPQSMAYALLAGLPPQVGLYASILPPILNPLLGTSRVLAVGLVAVDSLMVAVAIANIAPPNTFSKTTFDSPVASFAPHSPPIRNPTQLKPATFKST